MPRNIFKYRKKRNNVGFSFTSKAFNIQRLYSLVQQSAVVWGVRFASRNYVEDARLSLAPRYIDCPAQDGAVIVFGQGRIA